MRKILITALSLLVILTACNSDKKKAFEFNQKLAKISQTLNEKGTRVATELALAVNTRDFTTVDSVNKDLLEYVKTQRNEVNTTPDVGGSEQLKSSMVEFLDFEKELITSAFLPFGMMNKESSDDESQQAVNHMVKKTSEETKYLAKVQAAQKEFAKKNGFKVEEKKP